MYNKLFLLLFLISCSVPYQKEIKTSKEDLKQIEIRIEKVKTTNKKIKKKAEEINDIELLNNSNEINETIIEINKYQKLLGVRLNNVENYCKMEVNKYKYYKYYFYISLIIILEGLYVIFIKKLYIR